MEIKIGGNTILPSPDCSYVTYQLWLSSMNCTMYQTNLYIPRHGNIVLSIYHKFLTINRWTIFFLLYNKLY